MKNVKLMALNIKNFKGIKQYSLDAEGESLDIYGDNATGKTTIFDAFTYLLFGKDSNDRTDFEIKPLDENGKVLEHGLDHEVEGIFQVGDQTIELKRIFKEIWSRKQGTAHKVFTGNTTKYFIDDVPCSKKKEFTDKVEEIASEETFKLLTNPLHFNEKLHWTDRRDILIQIAGNVTDEEIAEKSGNSDLEKLIERLNGKDIEGHKKSVRQKLKAINEELETIPTRIDEIQLGLPDISGLKRSDIEAEIQRLNDLIDQKESKIADIKNGSEVVNKRKEISEIDLKLSEIKNKHESSGKEELYKKQAKKQELESNIKLMKQNKEHLKMQADDYEKSVAEINEQVKALRDEYREENKAEFTHESDCECPTCGQELPEDQVEKAREDAKTAFNQKKSAKLEQIQEKAKAKQRKAEEFQESADKNKKKMSTIDNDIEKDSNKLDKIKSEIDSLIEETTDVYEDPAYQAKEKEKQDAQEEISRLQDQSSSAIQNIQEEIQEIRQSRSAEEDKLNDLKIVKRSDDRMNELKEREQELSEQYEEYEKDLYLIETYTKNKVDILESKINSHFQYASFRLFEKQLNDGIKETCETMFQGIPFSRGLNNANKIAVGIDIIRTLQEHYGLKLPIITDNRESIVRMPEIDTQMISLIVSEDHPKLSIQKAEKSA